MDWWLWLLIVVATAMTVLLVVTFTWASVMLIRVARGDYGDLTNLSEETK
jgi:hypothetical protein